MPLRSSTSLTRRILGVVLLAMAASVSCARAEAVNFAVAWAASAHGAYPVGNATAQPELRFAFPNPQTGASDQSFRLMIRPDIWGKQARIRLSNAFGTKPVTFVSVHIGLQQTSSALVPGTNRPVTFAGNTSVTIGAGASMVSDPVTLSFVDDPNDTMLTGRRLAMSFHVVGDSGPMTWHAELLRWGSGRQAASKPSGIRGDGIGDRPEGDHGQIKMPWRTVFANPHAVEF